MSRSRDVIPWDGGGWFQPGMRSVSLGVIVRTLPKGDGTVNKGGQEMGRTPRFGRSSAARVDQPSGRQFAGYYRYYIIPRVL
jgi:hypothetical protein